MRTNARGVRTAALIGLLMSGAWWTWREFAPVRQENRINPHGRQETKWEDLGLLAMLNTVATNGVPANPFAIPDLRHRRSTVAATPPVTDPGVQVVKVNGVTITVAPGDPEPAVKSVVVTSTKPTPAPAGPKPAPGTKPEPEVPPVSLTYRGMFRRPDGKPVALIQDSESKGSRFYQVGQAVFGLEIGAPSDEGATLVLADGTTVTIPLGESTTFRGGRHVD